MKREGLEILSGPCLGPNIAGLGCPAGCGQGLRDAPPLRLPAVAHCTKALEKARVRFTIFIHGIHRYDLPEMHTAAQ